MSGRKGQHCFKRMDFWCSVKRVVIDETFLIDVKFNKKYVSVE